MQKGFTLIEIIIVVVVLGILATLAIPMYADYSKRTKTSEIPFILKSIIQEQTARMSNPATASYATEIESLDWRTSSGGSSGKYYNYGTSGVTDCDPGTIDAPLPVGLAEAWAIDIDEVPINWRSACMDFEHNLLTSQ